MSKRVLDNIRYKYRAYLIWGGMCGWCGEKDPTKLTLDHVIAKHKIPKGMVRNNIWNHQLLCEECHQVKTDLIDNAIRVRSKSSEKFWIIRLVVLGIWVRFGVTQN